MSREFLSHADRSRDWQERQQASGRCTRCAAPHERINPRTGRRTRLCGECSAKVRVEKRAYYLAHNGHRRRRRYTRRGE